MSARRQKWSQHSRPTGTSRTQPAYSPSLPAERPERLVRSTHVVTSAEQVHASEPARTAPAEGREVVATVLFADLRGFTALAESRPPGEVLWLVNRCIGEMARCIHTEGGKLDKFLGDGLMAVFGLDGAKDHAERAVAAGRSIQTALDRARPELEAGGWASVGIGVGMETGRVVTGRVGVPERSEATVLGDVVNVAARLTAGAAAGEVVLGAGTASAVGAATGLVPLGEISIRGRRQPVRAFRLP